MILKNIERCIFVTIFIKWDLKPKTLSCGNLKKNLWKLILWEWLSHLKWNFRTWISQIDMNTSYDWSSFQNFVHRVKCYHNVITRPESVPPLYPTSNSSCFDYCNGDSRCHQSPWSRIQCRWIVRMCSVADVLQD